MRIAECSPVFLPSIGGTELATLGISKGLKELGQDVHVSTHNVLNRESNNLGIHLNYSAELRRHEKVEGIEVTRFPISVINSPSTVVSVPLSISLLCYPPDLIHIQGLFDLPNLLCIALAGKLAHTPVVVTTHAIFETYEKFNKHRLSVLFNVFMRVLNMVVLKFIVLSNLERDLLAKSGVRPSKVVVIPNGIKAVENEKDDYKSIHQDAVGGGDYILCLCRFARYKNLELLVRAFRTIGTSTKLVIAGRVSDDAYFLELKKIAAADDRIVILRDIPEEVKRRLYLGCMFFVLPSAAETSPLSIIEAMTMAKPVIACNAGAISELVLHGENGLLFNPSDSVNLRHMMEYLLEDAVPRETMGRKSLEMVQDRTWERVSQMTLRVFREIEGQSLTKGGYSMRFRGLGCGVRKLGGYPEME